MHRGSHVRVTVVQMPAVNTPQFSWVLSRLPRHPQPVPPIYQPEVAARAVVYAAGHPRRKQYYVGASTVATMLGNRVAAGLLDRYLARTGYGSQQTGEPTGSDRPSNLWQPLDRGGAEGRDFGAHGAFDEQSHALSPQTRASRHTGAAVTVAAAAGVAVAMAVAARRR